MNHYIVATFPSLKKTVFHIDPLCLPGNMTYWFMAQNVIALQTQHRKRTLFFQYKQSCTYHSLKEWKARQKIISNMFILYYSDWSYVSWAGGVILTLSVLVSHLNWVWSSYVAYFQPQPSNNVSCNELLFFQ